MPRRSKGARLQLKAARRDKSGKITHQATWIIRDNGRDVSTGCTADEIAAAERKLKDYIASKYTPKRRVRHIDDIPIADVLSIYLDAQLEKLRDRFKIDSENEDTVVAIRKFKKRIERLNVWWGAKMLGEVNGEACRAYRKKRRSRGGARRDLEDLRAAIGYHAAEGYHREIVKVSLPEKGEPRDKWLTRSDAAKLIWTCWRYREMQRRSRRSTDDVKAPTAKRPLRHLARFILLGSTAERAREPSQLHRPFPRWAALMSTSSTDGTTAANRAARKPTSANLRSRFLCACLRICGVGTGSIQKRSISSSSMASR